MKTIYITFTYDIFKLIFEDNLFAEHFKIVFQASDSADVPWNHTIHVIGYENINYSILLDNCPIQESMSREEAVYCITSIFGDSICSHADDSICIMHAASVLINDRIISFSGSSGSGKTTLSLLFAKYGNYVGDEYAFFDIKTGDLWHECHPFQLKEGSKFMLHGINPSFILEAQGQPFGKAYYVSLESTNYRKIRRDEHIKVKVIVFPDFDHDCTTTTICRLTASELPSAILQSLMGKDSPAQLFRKFIQNAAARHMHFIKIKFCDGTDAAEKLFKYIEEKKEETN